MPPRDPKTGKFISSGNTQKVCRSSESGKFLKQDKSVPSKCRDDDKGFKKRETIKK
jgi:hypothetical protein